MPHPSAYIPHGVIPAVLLPFENDLSIDEAGFRKHLRDVAATPGISAITVNAHSTEVASCSFDEQRRVLAATSGGVRYINLYVPNGQAPGSEKFAYKLRWLEALTRWLEREVETHPGLVVVGDFNVAPEDRDVHDPAVWVGSVHVSPEERAALQGIFDLGLVDAFRQFEQPEKSFSWWDYRQGSFRRNNGLRIDLILAHRQLVPRLQSVRIDVQPRRAEQASDHTPVIAYFDA
jgi:exodeoxyribonuclease-3